MREFFRGWRRKVGCFTLVMVCWLMAQTLLLREYNAELWEAFERSKESIDHEYKPDGTIVWDYGNGAIHVLRRFSFVPYLAIVIPLTLLSAYLILSKPRTKVERDA